MRVITSVAAGSLLVTLALCVSAAAEERVVRVPPGGLTAQPWPKCGSFADEAIERGAVYQVSATDPDGKWTFDDVGFGRRSPREDAGSCVEVFVPTKKGCSSVAVQQRSRRDSQWVGVTAACAPGNDDPTCGSASNQPELAGFIRHPAVSPNGTRGCWMQMRNWRRDSTTENATDFKLQWTH